MKDDIRNKLGIDPTHTVRSTGGRSEKRRGQDNDISCYDVIDPEGKTVAQYELHDSMSIYPPFSKTLYFYRTTPPESSCTVKA